MICWMFGTLFVNDSVEKINVPMAAADAKKLFMSLRQVIDTKTGTDAIDYGELGCGFVTLYNCTIPVDASLERCIEMSMKNINIKMEGSSN